MPSNFTEHYNLNQWEPEDTVRRADFNADNEKIDGALAGKADVSALNNLRSTVSSLSSTVSGHSSSLSSQSGSISRLGNCQIYHTTYAGDGSSSRSLSLPGYPVFIRVQEGETAVYTDFLRGAKGTPGSYTGSQQPITWSARSVTWTSSTFNRSGTSYVVMVLMDMSK